MANAKDYDLNYDSVLRKASGEEVADERYDRYDDSGDEDGGWEEGSESEEETAYGNHKAIHDLIER